VTGGVRKTVSQAAVYGFGTVLANAAGIIMLPIYTRYLTPSDYGLLEYLQMIIDVVSITFGARVFAGVFRVYFDQDDEKHRRATICTALLSDLGLHAIGATLLIAFAGRIASFVIREESFADYLVIFSLGLVTMAMTTVPMIYLRALERPWWFISVSLTKLLMQIGLNIWFVVHMGLGPRGVIYSTLITGTVVGGGLCIWTLRRTGWMPSVKIAERLLRFGVPFAIAGIGTFYTTYGDRFFINHFWSLAEVGVYALGYRFAFALGYLVFGTFNQAWAAQAYQVYREPDGVITFRRVFVLLSAMLVFVGTALSVLAHDFLRVMADPSFLGASAIVPILVGAIIARGLGEFGGFGIRYAEKTKYALHASLMSVAVMTIGYLLLIPPLGGLGAAIATLGGAVVEAFWNVRMSEKLVPISFPWRRAILAVLLGSACYVLAELVAPQDLILSIIVRSVLLLVFMLVLYFSPVVDREDRRVFGDMALAVMSRFRRDHAPREM
jgi:O-antigen/teichoic acid export membrane protein